MSESQRSAAVIGAGIAGSSAALGLLDAGFDVTLYSDRERASLRNDVPPTGVAVLFGKSREWDAQIIEDIYQYGNTTGISARLYSGDGDERADVLQFNPDFGYEAQAVDVRLRSDDRIGRFLDRGGKFEVRTVDAQALDAIAADHDLTLVATGKGGLSSLFPIDPARSHYDRPQRQLLQVTLKGLDQGDDVFDYRNRLGGRQDLFNLDAQNGEAWLGPFQHKDEGLTWSFIGFAKTDGEWADKFRAVTDAASARETFLDLYRTYFPHDVAEVEKLQTIESDPHSWIKGAVTPAVREAVGVTENGHVVAAIGDTAIAVDPVAGQGAQNALIQVAELVKAASAHDGDFTADWLRDEFEKHWERRGHAATEVTRLFLGDPDYADHLELAFPAAAVNTDVASALFGLLSEPNPLLTLKTRDDVLGFITAVAGEPADDVLARFVPAGEFSTKSTALAG
ncbi:styrene monooxygenase/indole monooxygenase family protein [Williamsia sterculiae]|uniref:Dehydrogenase (Flavoprotein) n=1 Tax=Williamsia sterculiae TaxID=1344003 RepID=A0A1N7DR92_9NOCA|nr:styrene monooxygenase/indole monooxygenase family protein [Williamsia sterculiae]SIR78340.1 Dehydrogenase (flavoprotein) [Williamsia sterculiae]